MKYLVFTLISLVFLASPAEARHRHAQTYAAHPDCNVLWPCAGVAPSPRGLRVVKAMGGFGSAQQRYTPRVAPRARSARHHARARTMRHHARRIRTAHKTKSSGTSLAGVVPQLASKIASIVSNCGSQVISAVRHTYVAGTHKISQHANGTAVDVSGNPACIYSMLHGWPGGYSVDYGRVRHVHISIGGREAGLRFVHGGEHYRHYANSYQHHRYASR